MAIERDDLERLIAEGRSLRAMAAELDVSYTTVRHWMRRHGLSTPRGRRLAETAAARAAGASTVTATCSTHGRTIFVRRGADGFRCRRCGTEAVDRARRKIKATLVAEAGGGCARCGYDACVAALQFHHVDPRGKAFGLAAGGIPRSLARARAEAAKCVLLCANCHAEIESGGATIATDRTCR